jgi:hypothetical protein
MSTVILPGYYPDPTVCRAGERFLLAASSFEYAPGVPLFESDDLLTWRPVGHALHDPSQLTTTPGLAGASRGVYAPTLRHHDGTFWMTTTNVDQIERGHLIVHATDPAGPWSEPVWTTGVIGIDPDLAWGDDGICRLTWSDAVRGGISQVQVDPTTGTLLSEPVEVWRGTGGAHPEGPHLVRRGAWWYLVIAEGGTGHGHMVTVARSPRVEGPFEACPGNPVLTHRSTADPVQSTGHADLVELPDGTWAMVHLGTRPRGSFPRWHTNGRETFLVGIDWVDDWPVVVPDRFVTAPEPHAFDDDFAGAALHPRWISPGVHPAGFATPGPGGLALRAGRSAADPAAVHLLAARVEDLAWSAAVHGDGDLALTLRVDDAHQVSIERVAGSVSARAVVGPLDQVLAARTHVPPDAALVIRAEAPHDATPGRRSGPDEIALGVDDGAGFTELVRLDGRYLSTEVAGGFTGRVVGVEAIGADARVTRFRYTGT